MSENIMANTVERTGNIEDVSGVEIKLPKNNKANRYYYRHKEEISERRKQQRLEKKNLDRVPTKEELQKKKMEFLGLIEK